ncbi:MAG: 1-deoxy-D-xylulose-5-phosphate reductoisomerase, partial [Actinobacteria bacterium]|nr:1-deoxy-D-xylulose-5-phosphate reductoisomerase [Actinomycetota bacterium]
MKKLVVLGCTGSIGAQTLDVVRANPEKFTIVALAANRNIDLVVQQAREFSVEYVVMGDESCRGDERLNALAASGIEVAFGSVATEALASLPEADYVLNALVGAAGLRASYAALTAGKRLALANKESLVVGGDLLIPLSTHETLLPVDSEHGAIYQCLLGEDVKEVSR